MSEKKLFLTVLPLALFCACFIAMAAEQMTANDSAVDGRYAFASRNRPLEASEPASDAEPQSIKRRNTSDTSAQLLKQTEMYVAHLQQRESSKPQPPRLKLMAISFCESKPAESIALIQQADETSNWLRPSSKIGNLTIESIQEKTITVSDGQKTHQMHLSAD